MACLVGSMPDIENLLRQRNRNRTDGLASAAGDTQSLGTGRFVDAVVEGSC